MKAGAAVGAALRDLRAAAGMSVDEMAAEVDVDAAVLAAFEVGTGLLPRAVYYRVIGVVACRVPSLVEAGVTR